MDGMPSECELVGCGRVGSAFKRFCELSGVQVDFLCIVRFLQDILTAVVSGQCYR